MNLCGCGLGVAWDAGREQIKQVGGHLGVSVWVPLCACGLGGVARDAGGEQLKQLAERVDA